MIKALVIIVLALAVFSAAGYFIYDIVVKPHRQAQQEIAQPAAPPPDPSLPEFEKVRATVKTGSPVEARDALERFVTDYPFSGKLTEAKDLLGEVNSDIFFSTTPAPDKKEYIVKSGDALAKITKKFKTTAELIMRQNNLLDPTKLQIGQMLLISEPAFSLVIERKEKRVILFNHGTFFKQYKPRTWEIPAARGGPVKTTVSETIAWRNGERVAFGTKEFAGSQRWITLAAAGYTLYAEPAADAGDKATKPPGGIGLDPAQAEELATLVGRGVPVVIQ